MMFIDYLPILDRIKVRINSITNYLNIIQGPIVGLFSDYDLEYEVNREKEAPNEPTLTEMTELAIKRLEKEENGYYLFVEGGRIDHGHHDK